MITEAQALRTNPASPLLTAHDAGRVYAFRGLTCPAGASPICLRGFYEAEREMMTASARALGSKGGKAAAKNMSKKALRERAEKAAAARWAGAAKGESKP